MVVETGAQVAAVHKRLVFNDPRLGRMIADGCGAAFDVEHDNSIAVVNDSYPAQSPAWLRGGVVFTAYTGASISQHVFGRESNWMTTDFLWAAFDYPFNQLGCGRIFGLIEGANAPALQFVDKLGYDIVATLPGMFASGAGVVVCMERDKCRWLKLRPRHIVSSAGM